jgi:hypothetical protein
VTVWITQQAADLLGCHVSLVGKLVARGGREERSRARSPPRRRKGRFEPPDAAHDGLTSAQAAELLGVSAVAVKLRCRRGRLPFVEKAGRRWFRRDHLELVRHADLVKRPSPASHDRQVE